MPPRRHQRISFTDQPGLFDNLDDFTPAAEIAPAPPARRPSRLRFVSFGSGSSGNCAYLGDDESGILIDAGVEARKVEADLEANGIAFKQVKGILLTHDHSDHVRYVYALLRSHRHVGLYCTPRTLSGILARHNFSRRLADYHRPVYKEFGFELGPFTVIPFDVSHDGTDNVGYFLTHTSGAAFALATDLGCITPRVDNYMRQADHIMIEANYDLEMLLRGPYPEYLKRRIQAEKGHLDNRVTGAFLAEIYTPRLRNVFLCHLSNDNNRPDVARQTVADILVERTSLAAIGDASGDALSRDLPLQLTPLPRFEASPLFIL